ncbi:MAG: pimeloyl-ACP methyl ester carboxylesterase [Planctomycetota bacterium]|jgi:pimeloyl-ACP methyl ester carboxylesterase
MLSRVALSFSLLLASVCSQQVSKTADALLSRAGDSRPVYERAWHEVDGAERQAYEFLLAHMPKHDFANVQPALLLENVRLGQAVRASVPWGAGLSDEQFHNYVVPYAQANETRESWRPEMVAKFLPLVKDCKTAGEAARKLNETIFNMVSVHYSTKRRRADQSPSESIEQGKASCTGLSILLADACRACCVPARVISVRWPHKAGNHTWVEVWDGNAWRFVGADEPDPKGFDRAWFVGDAKQCGDADRAHRVWAVSFQETGERFRSGWGPEFWGVDVTSRYSGASQQRADEGVRAQVDRYFAADEKAKATFSFDMNLDAELKTKKGDARLRKLVWQSLKAHDQKLLQPDHSAHRVRAGGKESAFTVKEVGTKPEGGWPLVIAMHGGGGVAKQVNDSQWRQMQSYYNDHPESGGYLYCALRAPTDDWNGFYTDYFYPLMEKLIRQFVICSDVDPDRVIAIGYSHGGYGAFAVATKMPDRFAAVHASAAAPTDGQCVPDGLHSLQFSFMVGGKDTAYERRERCETFAEKLRVLKLVNPRAYPATFTLVEGHGHGGLPDRDLLGELLWRTRQRGGALHWVTTDSVITDHYRLHVENPKAGDKIWFVPSVDELTVSSSVPVDLRLDARRIDMKRAHKVVHLRQVAGATATMKTDNYTPAPSLRTLSQTMQQRGDPNLAATWILSFK